MEMYEEFSDFQDCIAKLNFAKNVWRKFSSKAVQTATYTQYKQYLFFFTQNSNLVNCFRAV